MFDHLVDDGLDHRALNGITAGVRAEGYGHRSVHRPENNLVVIGTTAQAEGRGYGAYAEQNMCPIASHVHGYCQPRSEAAAPFLARVWIR